MELSVRAFVLDDDDNILLVKNASEQPWVLPGGHVEDNETIYEALEREIEEEVGIPIAILGSDCTFSDRNISGMPLPVSIHTIKYEHRRKGTVQKLEFIFFARAQSPVEVPEDGEIQDYQWISQDDLLAMEPNVEIWRHIQEVLENNQDLLELL